MAMRGPDLARQRRLRSGGMIVGMVRLFVAVWPPDDVIAELRALPRKERPGIRWIQPEHWHVTLRFLGDADIDEVAERLDRADLPTAGARYGPGVDLMWERTIVVPVHGLDELAASVISATRDVGDEAPPKRFVGHATLARVKRRARIPPIVGLPVSAVHDVAEIALVMSMLRPTGAVYETIATWPVG